MKCNFLNKEYLIMEKKNVIVDKLAFLWYIILELMGVEMKKELKVKNDSIDVAGIKKDYKDAIMEYIWNGFDADATIIDITYKVNELGGISEIKICDNGSGINFENIDNTFGAFLSSEKRNSKNLVDNIHGSKGKGRFSFICFAHYCKWNTIYTEGKEFYKYSIKMDDINKKEYELSDKQKTDINNTGTEVIITGIDNLLEEDINCYDFEECLLNNFSWYLYLNKEKQYKLNLNGKALEYNKFIDTTLSENYDLEIEDFKFKVYFIKWLKDVKSKYYFHMLDDENNQKYKAFTRYNNNGIGFMHSVYINSSYFNNFQPSQKAEDDNTQISLLQNKNEENNERSPIYKELIYKLDEIVTNKCKQFLRVNSSKLIEDLEKENVFPIFPNDKYGNIRRKDLVDVVKEVYCVQPRIFRKANTEQKKTVIGFLNLLLDSDERKNVITIMESVTKLSKEERENLANLLEKTTLNNIVKTLQMLEERNETIGVLKNIVFKAEQSANERDHIQKIMEKNFWIFGEQYHLVTADKNFEKALKEYLYILDGKENEKDLYKIINQDKLRRMDIFMCAKRPLDTYSESSILEENIVLELKAPYVPIDKKIFRQIEDYMDLIKGEPQFNSTSREWKFYAISNRIDDFIKEKYKENEDKGLPFLVKKVDNCKIFIMTWDDIFKSFEHKYRYLYEKLNFEKSDLEAQLERKTKIDRADVDNLTEKILQKEAVNL